MFYSLYRNERCCLYCSMRSGDEQINHIPRYRYLFFDKWAFCFTALLAYYSAGVCFSFYFPKGDGKKTRHFLVRHHDVGGVVPMVGRVSRDRSVSSWCHCRHELDWKLAPPCGERADVSLPPDMLSHELLPPLYCHSVRPSLTFARCVHLGADREVELVGLTFPLVLLFCIESHRDDTVASGAPCYG